MGVIASSSSEDRGRDPVVEASPRCMSDGSIVPSALPSMLNEKAGIWALPPKMALYLRASWALMIDAGRGACDGEGVKTPLLPLEFLFVVVASCLIIAPNSKIVG